jgi:ribonuclease D
LSTEALGSQAVIGLDTDTSELEPYTARLRRIQLATPNGVSIIDLNALWKGDLRHSDSLFPIPQLLSYPHPIKIVHNAKFDANFIKHNLGFRHRPAIRHTLLASQLVSAGNIEERHGLEVIPGRYFNKTI